MSRLPSFTLGVHLWLVASSQLVFSQPKRSCCEHFRHGSGVVTLTATNSSEAPFSQTDADDGCWEFEVKENESDGLALTETYCR